MVGAKRIKSGPRSTGSKMSRDKRSGDERWPAERGAKRVKEVGELRTERGEEMTQLAKERPAVSGKAKLSQRGS